MSISEQFFLVPQIDSDSQPGSLPGGYALVHPVHDPLIPLMYPVVKFLGCLIWSLEGRVRCLGFLGALTLRMFRLFVSVVR